MMIRVRSIVFLYLVIFTPLIYTSCKSKKIITDASKSNAISSGSIKERYASLLNVKEKELNNEKLYRFIDSWIGVPHRSGGMDKRGVDCSGFTFLLEKEVYDKDLP
ncbi:MAG: glycoside hydrolase, partial [Daejeonella sp.]|nr:glycoside hydrolase [Daejeonella sp.]